MAGVMVHRDIVMVFYLFVMVVGHWRFCDGAFLGTGIKAYFKLY